MVCVAIPDFTQADYLADGPRSDSEAAWGARLVMFAVGTLSAKSPTHKAGSTLSMRTALGLGACAHLRQAGSP